MFKTWLYVRSKQMPQRGPRWRLLRHTALSDCSQITHIAYLLCCTLPKWKSQAVKVPRLPADHYMETLTTSYCVCIFFSCVCLCCQKRLWVRCHGGWGTWFFSSGLRAYGVAAASGLTCLVHQGRKILLLKYGRPALLYILIVQKIFGLGADEEWVIKVIYFTKLHGLCFSAGQLPDVVSRILRIALWDVHCALASDRSDLQLQ